MARMGVFAGPTEEYGLPLSFVHPADNDMAKARFQTLLLDPRLDLTNRQRREIQQEIDQLSAVFRLIRDR